MLSFTSILLTYRRVANAKFALTALLLLGLCPSVLAVDSVDYYIQVTEPIRNGKIEIAVIIEGKETGSIKVDVLGIWTEQEKRQAIIKALEKEGFPAITTLVKGAPAIAITNLAPTVKLTKKEEAAGEVMKISSPQEGGQSSMSFQGVFESGAFVTSGLSTDFGEIEASFTLSEQTSGEVITQRLFGIFDSANTFALGISDVSLIGNLILVQYDPLRPLELAGVTVGSTSTTGVVMASTQAGVIPEPETYALLSAGLFVLILMRSRENRRTAVRSSMSFRPSGK